MGGGVANRCVRRMQWWCCVFVVDKFWGIVPCVYKIYALGRFHGLLETFLDPTVCYKYAKQTLHCRGGLSLPTLSRD
jgi:hypothetical protein